MKGNQAELSLFREPSSVQTLREPSSVQTLREPSSVQTLREPSSVQTLREPSSVQTLTSLYLCLAQQPALGGGTIMTLEYSDWTFRTSSHSLPIYLFCYAVHLVVTVRTFVPTHTHTDYFYII